MSNIEDIKFIEEMIKEYKTFGDLHNPDFEDTDRIYKALENMLKRIKELEEENNKKQKYINMASEVVENSILKQKVKEILIEIQEEFNKLDKETDKQIKDKNKDYYKCKENIAIMQTLAYCRDKFEELLEEK